MNISGIGSTIAPIDIFGPATQSNIGSSTAAPSATPKRDSFRSDFAAILSAVQSGDIGAAQSALSTLQSDFPSAGAGYGPTSGAQSSTASTSVASTPKSDLEALIQAVKSGDIAGAQQSLAQLQTDAQARAQQAGSQQPGGHHHHHHHGGGATAPAATSTSTTSTSGSDQDASSSTTTLPNL